MNDITALMVTMKAAAEKATEAHERLSAMPSDGLFDASLAENAQLESDITALIAHNDASTPANVRALVEALEAKQPHHNGMMQLSNDLVMAKQRIAELENDEVRQRLANAEHQLHMAELAKHNLKASRKAQFRKRKVAEKRIAELEESRNKLRDGMAAIYNAICADGASTSLSAILTFVKRAHEESAAGILVIEGEGQ